MLPEPAIPVEAPPLGSRLSAAILERYAESHAAKYGISTQRFQQIVTAVVVRYAADAREAEKLELVATLHIEELILARACTAGNEASWDVFLARFRAPLFETACRIARDEATGRELADGLYTELYGIPNREGRRISKLDYYMGRGSLEGWLRTVLAQQHINRCRSQAKDVSLDEQIEAGASFPARQHPPIPIEDNRVAVAITQTLADLGSEERFLLASYFLDQRTLANIGRQLRVHESTVSRKMEKLTGDLCKRIRKRLQTVGVSSRQCDELMREIDVRDLHVNVAENLRQERPVETF